MSTAAEISRTSASRPCPLPASRECRAGLPTAETKPATDDTFSFSLLDPGVIQRVNEATIRKTLESRGKTEPSDKKHDFKLVELCNSDIEEAAEAISRGRRWYLVGESAVNDFLVGGTEIAQQQGPGPLKKLMMGVKDTFLSSNAAAGLAVGGAVGAVLACGWLLKNGVKQVVKGVTERKPADVLHGTREIFLGAESGVLATQLAGFAAGGGALATASKVAGQMALPLALIHVGVDSSEGAYLLVQAGETKNVHTAISGLCKMGQAAGWMTALAAPGPGLAIGATFMAADYVNDKVRQRRAKKALEAAKQDLMKCVGGEYLMADSAPAKKA